MHYMLKLILLYNSLLILFGIPTKRDWDTIEPSGRRREPSGERGRLGLGEEHSGEVKNSLLVSKI